MKSRPPMLCIHGFTGSWRNWTPILDALHTSYDVTAARLLGHRDGQPLPIGKVPALGMLADGLERDMDAAGIDTAHLVGNSLGGWLALELASRGRARSVVALSPGFGWHADRRTAEVFAAFRRGHALYKVASPVKNLVLRSNTARRALLGHALHNPCGISREVAADIIDDNVECHGFDTLIREFDGLEPPLGRIECPVRIAWGEFDRIIPQAPFGTRFPGLVPNATFTTIPNVGHVPMYDDPRRVVAEIVEHTTLAN